MKSIRENTVFDLVNKKTNPTQSTDKEITFIKTLYSTIKWEKITNKPNEYPPSKHQHKEYAESLFIHNKEKYDLHDVVEQIVVFLEKELKFELQK